jgi:hypothetical protein
MEDSEQFESDFEPPPAWAVFPKQPETLNHYQVGDLVFCKSQQKSSEPFWPAKLIDPIEAPQQVRLQCVPDAVCVQFYGPSQAKTKNQKDYCWAVKEQLAPYEENVRLCETQKVPKRMRPKAFEEALREIDDVFRVNGTSRLGFEVIENDLTSDGDDQDRTDDDDDDDDDSLDNDDEDYDGNKKRKRKKEAQSTTTKQIKKTKQTTMLKNVLLCASCGVNCSRKELDAKNFCGLCSKMHAEGQYCPCCGKVWHYANCGPMIQCDTCEMWVHDICDTNAADILKKEADALRANEDNAEEFPYNCPTCAAGKIDTEAMAIKAARQARELEMERKKILSQIPKRVFAKSKDIEALVAVQATLNGDDLIIADDGNNGGNNLLNNVTDPSFNVFSPPPTNLGFVSGIQQSLQEKTSNNNNNNNNRNINIHGSPPSATKVENFVATLWRRFRRKV